MTSSRRPPARGRPRRSTCSHTGSAGSGRLPPRARPRAWCSARSRARRGPRLGGLDPLAQTLVRGGVLVGAEQATELVDPVDAAAAEIVLAALENGDVDLPSERPGSGGTSFVRSCSWSAFVAVATTTRFPDASAGRRYARLLPFPSRPQPGGSPRRRAPRPPRRRAQPAPGLRSREGWRPGGRRTEMLVH